MTEMKKIKKILAAFLLFISFSVNAEMSIQDVCFTIESAKRNHSQVIGDSVDHQNSAYFHGRIVLLMEFKELLKCHRFIKIKPASKDNPEPNTILYQDGS